MDDCLQHQFGEIDAHHWWFQGRRRIVASVMRRHVAADVAPGRPILDVGCGAGEMVDMLREFGTVSAIDPSPGAVARCRERFGDDVRVVLGGVPDGLPEAGSVDVVTAFDVLEHLDDDAGALRRFHTAVSPGGVVVLTVPALNWLWGPHDVLSHHRRRYTRKGLRRLLHEAGFDVVFASYFNMWLLPVVAAVRLVRRRRLRDGLPPASDFTMPSPAMNWVLLNVFASERALLRLCSLPLGVSIVVVARPRPTAAAATAGASLRSEWCAAPCP